jgi:hypothetical protein
MELIAPTQAVELVRTTGASTRVSLLIQIQAALLSSAIMALALLQPGVTH